MAIDVLMRAESSVKRIDEWKTQLALLETGSVLGAEETDFLGRELRAASIIAAMAEMEALLREMLVDIGAHINNSGTTISEIVPSLRPLALVGEFERFADMGRNKSNTWYLRLSVTQLEGSAEVAKFPKLRTSGPQPPLDGSTIKPDHISLIWQVLGMDLGDLLGGARTVASLKKCNVLRNDIAHRNESIVEVFRGPGCRASDIIGYLGDISNLIVYIGLKWKEYIDTQAYLRKN